MKLVTKVMAAVAVLLAGSASLGCVMILADEPKALNNMVD